MRQSSRSSHPVGILLERLRPLWVLLILPAFVAFDGRYLIPGLAALAVLWLLTGMTSGSWFRRTPLDWSWLIWLVMLGVAWWATALPDVTRTILAAFVAQAVAFWTVVVWLRSSSRAWTIAGALVVAAVALAALAPFWLEYGTGRLFAIPDVVTALVQRFTLPVNEKVNKNVMAGVLVGLGPVALALVAASHSRRSWAGRVAAAAASLIIFAALLLTQSRGAWIAAAWSVFFLLALRWRRVWLAVPVLLVALVVLFGLGYLDQILAQAVQTDALGGMEGRLEVWSRAIYAIQDFSFTGIGLGTFGRVIPVLYPYFFVGINQEIPHAHNLWLQVAVDLGLPGLIAFMAMIFGTGWLSARSLRLLTQNQDGELAWLLRGCVAGLSAVLVHGVLDAPIWNTRPAFLTWALWGLTVGLSLWAIEQRSREAAPAERLAHPAEPTDTALV